MAIERFLNRLGLRKSSISPDPKDISVSLPTPVVDREHPQFPGLEQYPEALAYLSSIHTYPGDIAGVYPVFSEYQENISDNGGHAFHFLEGNYKRKRLDRVIFPSRVDYDFILGVDRKIEREIPIRVGYRTITERSIRMNVYPDTSISLQLQAATPQNRSNAATFFIDPQGDVRVSDLASKNNKYLNPDRQYLYHHRPQELTEVCDPLDAMRIHYFSQQFLGDEWGLTIDDIAIPSTELARKILLAPVGDTIDLREMI